MAIYLSPYIVCVLYLPHTDTHDFKYGAEPIYINMEMSLLQLLGFTRFFNFLIHVIFASFTILQLILQLPFKLNFNALFRHKMKQHMFICMMDTMAPFKLLQLKWTLVLMYYCACVKK